MSHGSGRDLEFSRRDILKGGGALAAGILFGNGLPAPVLGQDAVPAPPALPRKRVFRFAHLTDLHIQPELRAGEGVSACLRHVSGSADKPALIIFGGDVIMDGFGKNEARTRLQWDLLKKVTKDDWAGPVEYTLGNHDIWGWDKEGSQTEGSEAAWGKKWALEQFGVSSHYRSFDKAGWHFVILDSIQPFGKSDYTARLGEEQMSWLKADLAQIDPKTPVIVVSHIPIFAGSVLLTSKPDKDGNRSVGHSLMHADANQLRELFFANKNVKLCLSGHIHLRDRFEYDGVTYICDGAVSGAWWKGANRNTPEGYAVVDLYNDGTFENQYVTYGWKAGA